MGPFITPGMIFLWQAGGDEVEGLNALNWKQNNNKKKKKKKPNVRFPLQKKLPNLVTNQR